MAGQDTGTPKEGRFSKAKSLKRDSILETRELLHKLELMSRDIHRMPPEEVEKFWPQSTSTFAPKNLKKNEKEMLTFLLVNAQINIQIAELFKKHDIDLSDQHTKDVIKQQLQAQTIGH